MVFDELGVRYDRAVETARKRSSFFDHLWLTKERYAEALGGRLAAAIAYYGFFAAFALAMVAYAVLLKVFSNDANLVAEVDEFLSKYFTTLDTDQLKSASQAVQWFGLVSLVLAGIGWVDAWRSSQRALWRVDQHPGNFILLRLTDLVLLIVFGILMGISLTAIDGLASLFDWISGGKSSIYLDGAQTLLSILINIVIAMALITVLPRMHLSPSRLFPSAIAAGIGLHLLNSIGRYFILRTTHNPAYAVVAGAVGLLLYLYLFNQIVLWTVAYAATSQRGRALDMAWGKPRVPDTELHFDRP